MNGFKKSYTHVQSSHKEIPSSHSLKNISKIKNFSSSTSLHFHPNEKDVNGDLLNGKHNQKEFFVKRLFRNHSSSSDAHVNTIVKPHKFTASKSKILKNKSKMNLCDKQPDYLNTKIAIQAEGESHVSESHQKNF